MRRGYETLAETRQFIKPTTLPMWIGFQDAPKRKIAADPDNAKVIKAKLKKSKYVEFIAPKEKPLRKPAKEKKLTMTEDERNELNRIRGLSTRLKRCLATFKTDKELTTLQLSNRLNLARMSSLQLVKGWRDAGYVEQAYEVGVKDVKTWRILVSGSE